MATTRAYVNHIAFGVGTLSVRCQLGGGKKVILTFPAIALARCALRVSSREGGDRSRLEDGCQFVSSASERLRTRIVFLSSPQKEVKS